MNLRAISARRISTLDRRIWPIIAMIGFFGWIVMKEVSLPSALMATFAGIGLFGLVVTGIQSPELPFYVLVAYLPFSRVLVGNFGTEAYAFNLTNVLTALVLICYALNRISSGKPLGTRTPLNILVFAFCLLGSISLLRAGYQYGSWYIGAYITPLKRWLTPMFCYFLALWIVRDKRVLKAVVALIMTATAIAALMAVRDYMNIGDASLESSRIGGIAEQPNTLGAFFVYYMFLFLGFFLVRRKRFTTWLLLIPFGLCFRGIMVTFSRGAYLGFVSGLLATFWRRNKLLFLAGMTALCLAIAIPALLPGGIRFRAGQTIVNPNAEGDITESLEGSAAHRIEIWRGAVQMIKEHPLWGVGYGAFPAFIGRYTGGRRLGFVDAHNSYLLIAAEMGVPSLVVFLLIVVVVWVYTNKLYRTTTDPSIKAIALGFLGGLGGLVVTNMFGSRIDDQAVASYFWMLCGLMMRAVVMEQQAAQAAKTQGGAQRRARTGTPATGGAL